MVLLTEAQVKAETGCCTGCYRTVVSNDATLPLAGGSSSKRRGGIFARLADDKLQPKKRDAVLWRHLRRGDKLAHPPTPYRPVQAQAYPQRRVIT